MDNNDISKLIQLKKDVVWKTWSGWRGNHDQRIEDAKCSNCGYEHPTVKGSLFALSGICNNCGSIINFVEYENGERESIKKVQIPSKNTNKEYDEIPIIVNNIPIGIIKSINNVFVEAKLWFNSLELECRDDKPVAIVIPTDYGKK